MKKLMLFALTLAIFIPAETFAQFTLKAELRTRSELRNGYKELPVSNNPSFFITQRTRLIADYHEERLKTRISIQDSRVWGDETSYNTTGVNGDDASIDLKEGWAELLINNHFSLKAGRQEWIYDDERLLSKRNWNNLGVSYDALLLKYNKGKNSFDLGLSWNNKTDNTFGNDYRYYKTSYAFDTSSQKIITINTELSNKIKSQNFIRWQLHAKENLNLSAIVLATVFQEPNTADIFHMKNTIGANTTATVKDFEFFGSGYYQFGNDQLGLDVSAYFWSLQASYKGKKFKTTTGCDYLSGNDASRTDATYINTNHLFDLFYGNRHGKYGLLDYFNNMDKASGNGGLIDAFIKFKSDINVKNNIAADFHYFSLQNLVRDPEYTGTGFKALNKNLGYELDLLYEYKFMKNVSLNLGFSYILVEKSMEILQGKTAGSSTFPYWFYVILNVKPDLFSSQK